MKNIITSIITGMVLWVFALNSYAQAPAGYYTSAQSLSGYAKKTALFNIINKNYPSTTAAPINIGYGSLYAAYQGTGSYPSTGTDKKTNGQVWDMYSDIPSGTPPYVFTWGQTCGTYSAEGDCYNREHSMPQSWFVSASPMVSDLFHIYPTDGKVNGIRSNYPYGRVDPVATTTPAYTPTITLNGSKLGKSISPGYTGTVFEPIDAYKGDFARGYFYMATRYENIIGSWQNNGTANNVLDGSSNQVFDQWQLDLLYSWHIADPVSQKEINRNNNVFAIQGNRNPYIDNPLWVADVWGFSAPAPGVQFAAVTGIITEPATGNTIYTVNVVANSTVAFTINLNVGVASTATAGATNDYVLTTTTPISFAANQTSQTVSITVNADAITETDETVILILSSPSAGVPLLANSTHTLTIKDYVVPPPVQTPTTIETFGLGTVCAGLGTFTQFSVTGAPVWACNVNGRPATGTTTPLTTGAQVNGGSATASTANEDWLISPALTVTSNYKMDFWSRTRFAGGGLGLDVKISTNYTGTGDPNLATWVTLTNLEDDDADIWLQNPQIDLSSYAGTGRYIAFIYKCITATPSQGARWTLDDVAFYDNSTLPPSLTASPLILTNFGTVATGAFSSVQTYTLTGVNLTANTTVTAPANFQVSKDAITFSGSIIYTPAEMTTVKTVSVRFAPTSAIVGAKSGNITNVSGVLSQNVAVSGTESTPLPSPTLTATPATLTFGTVNTNASSAIQTYSLSGTNLVANTTVTAPANFEVSKNGTTFSGSISYTVAELATAQTVSVRFSPTSLVAGLKSGNITNVSGTAPAITSANVAVTGTESIPVVATLTANPATLTFGTTTTNINSGVQTYLLSGANLTANTTVTAPTNFEVSKNGTTFSSSIFYTTVELATPQTVTVRFSPISAVAGLKTGNITNVSTTASANVAVSGTEALVIIPASLTATPATLTFGTTTTNASSTIQTYSLSGANLVASTTVTAPANFEVSKNGTTFSGSISYTVADLATPQTVSVRFSPTSAIAGVKTGNITNVSATATANVAVTGTENIIPVPTGSNFVNFASASTTIREGAQGSLTLLFSYPTTVASTITIKALNGLNVTATDYSTTPALSGSSITLNVPVGASSASFVFNGTEDTDYSELNETVTFMIDAVGAGLTKGSADASIVNMTNYNNPTTALNTFENATKVYPNPAKDKVFVEMAQNQAVAGAFSVEIMDVTGRKVGTVSSDKITSEISVKDWNRGMYFFKFSNNKTQFIKKIVLE